MSKDTPLSPVTPAPAPRRNLNDASLQPVPGAVVRCLQSTGIWARFNAVTFLIFGLLVLIEAISSYDGLSTPPEAGAEEVPALALTAAWTQTWLGFLLAAGCLFAVPRLFRYSGAISRLDQARHMKELETALRHQRTLWVVLGSIAAVWVLSFSIQTAFSFFQLRELHKMETQKNPPAVRE